MALIGTSCWNPTGESMWSIVSRLSQCNHLNWTEVCRLFGSKDLRSFRDPATQDPNEENNFAVPALCVSTGWSPNVLKASFSRWYRPPWLHEEKGEYKRTCSKYLRACPSCLSEGSHLLLHQLEEWVRCPVHDEPLTTRCPRCQNLLGRFAITKEFENAGFCAHCREPVLNGKSKSNEQQERRMRIIKDYNDWMMTIQSTFDPAASKYRWIGCKATMKELIHIHQLVPGPSWVSHCMANGNRVRTSNWTWSGGPINEGRTARSHRIPADSVRMMYDTHNSRKQLPVIVGDFARFLCRGVQQQHGRLMSKLDVSCRNSGMQEWSSTECTPLYGDHVNAWGTAYWMWRRSLDEAFPLQLRWSRSRMLDPIQLSWIWASWRSSIGCLIWSPFKGLKRPYNAAFVRWLTPIWLTRLCEEHFSLFVGLSCRKVGDDWMNTSWLVGELSEVGRESLWIRGRDSDNREVVYALSTVAPIDEFCGLKHAGFTGTDDKYCESFDRLAPLIDLLGTHPENVRAWEAHWRAVRRRQRARRSSLLDSRKTSKFERHAGVSISMNKS